MNRVRPRLLLVDDHPLAREGLRAVLAGAGYDIVGDAADGEAAVRLAIELRPDLVLMDVRLGPGIDGLEATRQIVALGLSARVLMLTLHDTPAYVREALAAGASGYVLEGHGDREPPQGDRSGARRPNGRPAGPHGCGNAQRAR